MKTKQVNLTMLSKKYGECYVARLVHSERILAHAKRADHLMEKIKHRKAFKENKVVISWVPRHDAKYIFGVSVPLC